MNHFRTSYIRVLYNKTQVLGGGRFQGKKTPLLLKKMRFSPVDVAKSSISGTAAAISRKLRQMET
jgi:hypothetical protein